ncbi:MAG: hypothetical protein J6V68_04390 [Clostridia bacterium]|nr:hypothetical protein [Clostridia bacterium]
MSIVKGNMVYSVEEFDDFWLVKYSLGGIQFSYRVTKSRCQNFKELKKMITSDELFYA